MVDVARIGDVAADTGLSATTVSHALSGRRPVSEQTRQRVLASVAKLGYRPNLVAKALRDRATLTVAVIVADIANPFYPVLTGALNRRLSAEGYVSFICNTDGLAELEERFLLEMRDRNVDGIVVQTLATDVRRIREMAGPAMPLVILTNEDVADDVDHVGIDDDRGIGAAVSHLVAGGRRRIGFISGPLGSEPGESRQQAFRTAMERDGRPVDEKLIGQAPYTREGGYAAFERMRREGGRFDALMCANDLMAIGAIDAARALGLRVPEDVAVIGFDDIETAGLMTPRLTTVRNPAASIGEAAADALLRRLHAPDAEPQRIALPTELVVRDSA
ncbi:LacI family DNA-binding transcriptional regulator [Microbacterium algeriense]|uniref:LacI family DNA-binding transcriptional regulator n=1 Tax=Microbacterium algeriense TaxID=2615184 RepID=UPI0022E0B05B|nr:LacI family DNA-binding transcriptional regulator [Microbacterium algeriense]